jgi:hypothetical protein
MFTITPPPPQWWWRAQRHAAADSTLVARGIRGTTTGSRSRVFQPRQARPHHRGNRHRRRTRNTDYAHELTPDATPPTGSRTTAIPVGVNEISEHTRERVDRNVRRLLDDCRAVAVETLTSTPTSSTPSPKALLTQETLGEADSCRIVGVDRQPNGAGR